MTSDTCSWELVRTQAELQDEAERLRIELDLDAVLRSAGDPILVGSAALGLMAWRDLDITVVCDRLDHRAALAIVQRLGLTPSVREVRFRDDTGHWNTHPAYPDGLYVGVDCTSAGGRQWNIDIWFVDEPHRQPDLRHLRELPPRLADDARLAILYIKTAWCTRPEYGSSVCSFDIYRAVLDHGVRSLAEFDARHAATSPR